MNKRKPRTKRSNFDALIAFADGESDLSDEEARDAGSIALTVRTGEQVPFEFKTFGELVCSDQGFGLVTASPVQRAIQSATSGYGVSDKLWEDPVVREAFGGSRPKKGDYPDEVYLVSGIRCGKSLHAAAKGVDMMMNCTLEQTSGIPLGAGEIPRVSVVSLNKDVARQTFHHVLGNVMKSDRLRKRLLADPSSDSILMMHPLGRPVELKVVAGARSGATLVGSWSAGVIFDEAPRMMGQESGIVNLDDLRNAVRFRLLRGSQIWYVGSPWKPSGPVYEAVKRHHGKPSKKILVIRATSDQMNPQHWTPEVVAQAYKNDPETAAVELGAQFADLRSMMFDPGSIERAVREGPLVLPFEEGLEYCAAMDPATRTNAWTLTIFTRKENRIIQVGAWEWRSAGEPLDPDAVLEEVASIVHNYGIEVVLSDQWSVDAIRALGVKYRLFVRQEMISGREKFNIYSSLARRLEAGLVELCPSELVAQDMKAVVKKPSDKGMMGIVLPQTSDGRHCDYVPSTVLAAAQHLEASAAPKPDKSGIDALIQAEVDDDDMAREELEAGLFEEEMEEYGYFFG